MKAAFIVLFFIIPFTNSFSQSTPLEMTKKFFDLYKQGDSDKALDYLFSNSTDVNYSKESTKWELKKKLEAVGKYYGADLLFTKTAGPNIVMFTYAVRHQAAPLTVRIMYYKPNDIWQMQTFKFNDKIAEELEEASKANRTRDNTDSKF
jgi:hypothetical protein